MLYLVAYMRKKLIQLQKWIDQLVSQQNVLLTETDREYIDRSNLLLSVYYIFLITVQNIVEQIFYW